MNVDPEHGRYAGRSILEMLWEELDEAYVDLQNKILHYRGKHDHPVKLIEAATDQEKSKGVCLGLATAIAIVTSPLSPDVDAIRAECVERYQESK